MEYVITDRRLAETLLVVLLLGAVRNTLAQTTGKQLCSQLIYHCFELRCGIARTACTHKAYKIYP